MNQFQFTDQDFETQQGQGGGTKYIQAPSAQLVTITAGYAESFAKKTPAVKLTFTTEGGEVCEQEYYLNDGAFSISKGRIGAIAKTLGLEAQMRAISANSAQEFAEAIGQVLNGQVCTAVFKGVEVEKKDGSTFIKAELSFCADASDLEKYKEYVVSRKDKMVKRLAVTSEVQEELSWNTPNGSTENLPF